MKNVAFFSVLFNPEENAFQNIIKSIKFGFMPIVYANAVEESKIELLKSMGVVILGENKNVGLGKAFGELERYLKTFGVKYYLYFDQDTVVQEDAWRKILQSYKKLFTDPSVGMLFYGSNRTDFSDVVVSSGCLFSMSVINKIGCHDETYFVEGLDYEICLRLKKNNYKIRNIYIDSIDHQSLQDGGVKSILGIKFNVRVYGNRRWKDFNLSHIKLIIDSLASGQYKMLLFFLKSVIAFNVGEIRSRALSRTY